MPTGIDTLTAAPMTIEIGGRPLRIAPLTLADLGRLQIWIDAQLIAQMPDPIAIARRLTEGFPVQVQSELLGQALRDACDARNAKPTVPIGTPEAMEIAGTIDGIKEMLMLSLKKYQPDMSRDDVAGLMDSLLPGDLDAIFAHIFGTEGPPGPKAETPEAGAGGENPSIGATSTVDSGNFPTDSTPSRSAG